MADLIRALRNADAAGDVDAAKRITSMIRNQQKKGVIEQISAENPDVPDGGQVSYAKPKDRSIDETIEGLGEAALTTATGATTGALGFGVGTLSGVIGELTGRLKPGEGLEEAQALASKLTYLPDSEAGKEYVGDIGETLGVLPPVLGTAPSVGLNAFKVSAPKTRNILLKNINKNASDQVKKRFTKKLGDDRFEPRIFGMVKEARKQGFDDSVTTMIANTTPITKRKMLQQVNVVEKGKGNARIKALERTADIAGDALVKKFKYVENTNKQAGKQLGRVGKSLKGKDINIAEPTNSFYSDLEGIGVIANDDGTLNFDSSRIRTVAPARKIINDIHEELQINPISDALKAHEFKGFLDENLNFSKRQEGLSGKAEAITKNLRRGVNESISSRYPKYKEANKRFSDTVEAINNLQDVAGKKLDFSGVHADKAAGTLLRSQTNNTKGRANLLSAISDLEDVAKKYGASFDDDILDLSIFADELDAVFGSGARTSLRGEVGKAGVDSAIDISQMSIPGAIAVGAKKGAKYARGINEKNQIIAIKKLLGAKVK